MRTSLLRLGALALALSLAACDAPGPDLASTQGLVAAETPVASADKSPPVIYGPSEVQVGCRASYSYANGSATLQFKYLGGWATTISQSNSSTHAYITIEGQSSGMASIRALVPGQGYVTSKTIQIVPRTSPYCFEIVDA